MPEFDGVGAEGVEAVDSPEPAAPGSEVPSGGEVGPEIESTGAGAASPVAVHPVEDWIATLAAGTSMASGPAGAAARGAGGMSKGASGESADSGAIVVLVEGAGTASAIVSGELSRWMGVASGLALLDGDVGLSAVRSSSFGPATVGLTGVACRLPGGVGGAGAAASVTGAL